MKTLIFIPTYNEKENAPLLFDELAKLGIDADVLFLDDNSPDGTGKILDALAATNNRLRVIHRTGKLGIGSAHFEGIQYAYANGYSNLITMDCDFTHKPADIPKMISAGESADVDIVIASRYLGQNSLPGWNLMRRCLTHLGHLVTQTLLGMNYDATGALRLYKLDRIPREAFNLVRSRGYSFFFESLYVLNLNGFKIKEIPIQLPARTYGSSKMDLREVRRSIGLLISTFLTTVFNREKYEIGTPLSDSEIDHTKHDPQGWDQYWKVDKSSKGLIYDALASVYRRLLIRPSLNSFIRSTYKPGAKVLHAGCGSGQVDTKIRDYVDITALDISVNALNFYRKVHKTSCHVLHGSIFEIPAQDASFDGVYNLGVMEHFTEDEISRILAEFKRVLRADGKLLLFWPPDFGFSVNLFNVAKFFAEKVLGKKDVKFHPDEITRVRSKEHVTGILKSAGFKVVEYYFGPRDMFTQVMLVAEPCIGVREGTLTYGSQKAA